MTEIGFYHLTRTGPEQALPRLLARTLEAGERAVVRCRDAARLAALDESLWRADEAWLPHGSAADGDAKLQPIWLTTEDEAPNHGRFLFLLDGVESVTTAAFTRVFDLFDGTDEAAVAAARLRWKAARDSGHRLTYWQQTEQGWVRKT